MSEGSPIDRQALESKLAALRELKRRKQAAPLFYSEPHSRQKEALDVLSEEGVRGVLLCGGNRFGKSWWGRYVAWAYALGYWPHKLLPEQRRLAENGFYPTRDEVSPDIWVRRPDGVPIGYPAKILVVTGLSLDRGIGAVFWPDFEATIPAQWRGPNQIKTRRGSLGVVIHATMPNGAVVRFGSIEQGSMAFEGANYDLVVFDEPPTKAVFTACWRGLIDRLGRFVMAFTPLGDHAPWLHAEFVAGDRRDVRVISGAQHENPHLTRQALEDFEAGVDFTQEELEARKYGRWGFLSHRAFPMFDPAVHVIDHYLPPLSMPVRMACDPANRRPFFFLWGAYDRPRDTWIIYDEWPRESFVKMRSSPYGIQNYASMIHTTEGSRNVYQRFIDPKFGPAEYTVQGAKITSTVENFAQFGLHFSTHIPGSSRIETGIMQLKDRLHYEPDPDTGRALVPPKLLITRNCQNLIQAMENYSFVPPNARDDAILDEKLLEAYKDPIDTLRYLILPGPMSDTSRLTSRQGSRRRALAQENNFSIGDL